MDKDFVGQLIENLWVPATLAKIGFILVTAPFWWPLVKVMYAEILPAVNAPEDAVRVRRPPGEDPFLNIPLASHRARRGAAQGATRARRSR